MPYDPRMLQMARAGIGMMAPPPSPFDRTAPRQKDWWDQPMPVGQPANRPVNSPDDANPAADPATSANPAKPPSLLDMMMDLGRMTPAQYNKQVHGRPPSQQQGMAMASPWAWLGSLSGGGRP